MVGWDKNIKFYFGRDLKIIMLSKLEKLSNEALSVVGNSVEMYIVHNAQLYSRIKQDSLLTSYDCLTCGFVDTNTDSYHLGKFEMKEW